LTLPETAMRLPPLNALRAFEAAARHKSFARAADELCVTQGAVSRHVRLLEQHLGAALFRRRPHGVELTGRGGDLLPELTASFERIGRAARRVAEAGREIRVAAEPTVAGRWLVPRLQRFHDRHPGTRVSVGLFRGDYGAFVAGGADLGIDCRGGYRRGRSAGVEGVLLRREAMSPVCAPALLRGPVPLAEPADLARHVLLHPSADRRDWRLWLRAAGLAGLRVDPGQAFETLELATRAAVAGQGVGITDLHLFGDELAAGRLVAPFGLVVSEDTGYFLFAERGRLDEPELATFRDWLLAEVAAEGRA
jgi:LysR family glycine cleavage system transcriptional activator